MRVRIKLALKGKTIPINYKHYIQSLVYTMLGSDEKFKQLHNEGNRFENRKFKMFTISDLFGEFKYLASTKEITFLSNAYFDLACMDEDIAIKVSEYLSMNQFVQIGKNIVEHNGYDNLKDFFPIKEKMTFSSISPVTCYEEDEKRTNYFSPNDEKFKNSIINNIKKKYALTFDRECPLFLIPEIIEKKSRLMHFKKSFIKAYDISITFENLDQAILNIILNTGIGSKNSMGFGMLKYEE